MIRNHGYIIPLLVIVRAHSQMKAELTKSGFALLQNMPVAMQKRLRVAQKLMLSVWLFGVFWLPYSVAFFGVFPYLSNTQMNTITMQL